MTETICLYLCETHLLICLLKVQFGSAVNEVLECFDSKCEYCTVRKAKVRIFLEKDHWLVQEFLNDHRIIAQ